MLSKNVEYYILLSKKNMLSKTFHKWTNAIILFLGKKSLWKTVLHIFLICKMRL